ncbi:hypothetical protein CAI21_21745 [Alkalilimnicola ehrlichii]|uniref:Uncharacterized protein n=1 Tax=Alkalilimnicola ehrlichii TaxID=351052 RepID=A0A3E0WSR0_9GAMM|nr:hypothetical protein [Alkalilimnicola ehrlichii]RFA24400.1 hypothetical protein CAI21_21745 [Alkalilimnicola ehrlichii]RFA35191.1 hypothetical protein CAL65_13900 [Alkalilimnicola ehrlichii]
MLRRVEVEVDVVHLDDIAVGVQRRAAQRYRQGREEQSLPGRKALNIPRLRVILMQVRRAGLSIGCAAKVAKELIKHRLLG